jgi:hypothetical protein
MAIILVTLGGHTRTGWNVRGRPLRRSFGGVNVLRWDIGDSLVVPFPSDGSRPFNFDLRKGTFSLMSHDAAHVFETCLAGDMFFPLADSEYGAHRRPMHRIGSPAFQFVLWGRHLHKFATPVNNGLALALLKLLGGWWMIAGLPNDLHARRGKTLILRLVRVRRRGICTIKENISAHRYGHEMIYDIPTTQIPP